MKDTPERGQDIRRTKTNGDATYIRPSQVRLSAVLGLSHCPRASPARQRPALLGQEAHEDDLTKAREVLCRMREARVRPSLQHGLDCTNGGSEGSGGMRIRGSGMVEGVVECVVECLVECVVEWTDIGIWVMIMYGTVEVVIADVGRSRSPDCGLTGPDECRNRKRREVHVGGGCSARPAKS
ncbi:hypothetical protein L226DRAFT_307414 [Lentinus tigrinus ALCF2SS1-7]|uniref:Uncharacterized protein n=1 Tax=Lentinus tigrinus ALCF2SS1-6 TaxID=1328759 RepID=A0A5C2RXI2_9APHY|nr:hypothetical protein L227DRAFT_299607 [Lentinus tigrinus ALCF2SS1-6]RPD69127.1 hypothetical protein L226DRAFT_307414 [Lentinus tigrinus ALCF2SS1-7]